MSKPRTLALDAMGGDTGPAVTIEGAALAAVRHPELSFLLCGDQVRINAVLAGHAALAARSQVMHTDLSIAMDEKPSQAIRRGKGSSMWLALEAVKDGRADFVVSSGNTGALMALSRMILRPMTGIERPAIAALWPTVKSECIVLDVGANIGASATQLCEFAMMGSAMARALFHIERPSIGLLNVGSEEIKGNEEVKAAHALMKEQTSLAIDYRGYVEGDQIGLGVVDVVVVEGFAGNIALKTAEGTAKQVGQWTRDALSRTLLSKIGALLAQGGLRALKQKLDPRRISGGTFLGLNGIVIKAHGGTDKSGFASAIDLGFDMADSVLLARLAADTAVFQTHVSAAAAARG
jgi:phosphate acyltransferase